MKFSYIVSTESKERRTGQIDAESKQQALSKLHDAGFYVIDLREITPGFFYSLTHRITPTQIASITMRIYELLNGGLQLIAALRIIKNQSKQDILKILFTQIVSDIENGAAFSDVLAKYPQYFSPFYIGMVRSGEAIGGDLIGNLKKLSDHLNNERRNMEKVKTAMYYPAFIAGMGILTVIFLLTFLVPHYIAIFAEVSQSLPWPTVVLISLSSFMRNYGIIAIVTLITLIASGRAAIAKFAPVAWDKIKYHIPLVSKLYNYSLYYRFCRIMSLLMKNGLSPLEGLEIIKNSIGNKYVANHMAIIMERVTNGLPLSLAMDMSALFPEDLIAIVKVGEESGNLANVLLNLSQDYENDLAVASQRFVSIVEPLALFVVGAMVAFIVVAMVLPLFELSALL